MAFELLILLIIVQRISEMLLGNEHLKAITLPPLIAIDQNEKKQMVLLHSSFFVACLIEYRIHGQQLSTVWFASAVLILMLCQFIRYQSIFMLGKYWVPYPVTFPGQKIVTSGLYRFIRHPNYMVVIVEILIIPLIGQCYVTAFVFSILNFIFLKRRINIEEEALNMIPEYKSHFSNKRRLIPFLFSLFIVNAQAGTIQISAKNYEEADERPNYFKFIGESKKFGLIKTNFEGRAKKAILTYQRDNDSLIDTKLEIEVNEIDTDNSSRDEKMRDHCLSSSKHPTITVKIPVIKANEPKQEVMGTMSVMSKEIPILVVIERNTENTYSGQSAFKLSEANIPDPSIAIASVKDEFKIEFKVNLNP